MPLVAMTMFRLVLHLLLLKNLRKYFQISYGTFSKKYCGASKPDPITSTGNTMKVKFHSDYSVVRKGFSAVWKAVAS